MALHVIKKGLDLPLGGVPEPTVEAAPEPESVALLGADYVGLKPRLLVGVGDAVRRGQKLFEDRKNPGFSFTAPAAGTVRAVNRGERRVFQSLVIALSETELAGAPGAADFTPFESYRGPEGPTGAEVRALLLESGLWTAFRARPFGRVPSPEAQPHSIFVTAVDSNPLAPAVDVVLQAMAGGKADFERGLGLLALLTDGELFLCRAAGSSVEGGASGARVEEFAGPHPSGSAGLHIHLLDPVHRNKQVWEIGYQEVVAIGRLFATGRLDVERVISLGGPGVLRPRLLKTRQSANLEQLLAGELAEGENRVISGSALDGRTAHGEAFGFLGRYHRQVTVLAEERRRRLMGWAAPGFDRFSILPAFISRLLPGRSLSFTTNNYGERRAIFPVGTYDKVMPQDIPATFLLRALAAGDDERAEQLGCLELLEEDLALSSFVCPGKNDFGAMLRDVLTRIEKEG